MSFTLRRYAFHVFSFHFGCVFACTSALVLCAEFIELQRRAIGSSFWDALFMALLKTPTTLHQLFPLWVLAAALIAFMRLSQSNEFLALNSTGASTWTNIRPFLTCALILGLANAFVLQPLSIFCIRQYHLLEAQNSDSGPESVFHVFSSGVWIKQKVDDGYFLAHIQKMSGIPQTFHNISIHVLSKTSVLQKAYHAEKAFLSDNGLHMKRGWVFDGQDKVQTPFDDKILPYRINLETLFVQNFKPDLLYFWSLPRLMRLARTSFFPVYTYELKWQSLWASIFECIALTLFAAAVSLQLHRRYGSILFLFFGIFSGFLFYFSSQMARAFCLANVLSPLLASWFATFFIILTSLVLIFFLEEGHRKHR